MRKIIISILLSFTLAVAGGDISVKVEETMVAPVVTEKSSEWKHSISIYGWLPSFDGTFRYTIPGEPGDPGEPDQEGESSALDNLDFVFMGSYEVRKDKWSFLADMIYLGMSDSQEVSLLFDRVTVGSEQELDAWMLGFYGGYNIVETDKTVLDIIAGMRYSSLGLDVTLSVNNRSVSISPSIEYYDAVIGVKGEVNLSENWYVPYLFDIGAGDSDLTWQGQASIGYRFDWGDILATYRYVHYEKDDAKLIKDFDLYGPKVGLVFHF